MGLIFCCNKFGEFPSLWAATVASYCPSRPVELPKLIATEYRTQTDMSPCTTSTKNIPQKCTQKSPKVKNIYLIVSLQNFKGNPKLLAIVADCLRILSMQSPRTKQVFLECKGPQLLVEIMQTQDYKNLILMTSRLLKVLSVCPLNKQAIIGKLEGLVTKQKFV